MLAISSSCRSCQGTDLHSILELGVSPLANALLTKDNLEKDEHKFPLSLVFCKGCSLVQIKETVDPKLLFSNYFYFSSFSDTMLEHSRKLTSRIISERKLNAQNLVIEVASNDGYLLQFYKKAGVQVLGIEPAENIAEYARTKHSIPTVSRFFNPETADWLVSEGYFADVVHAHNVFAHVPDPNQFAVGLKKILKPKGVAIIEAPYLVDFIENVEFDTIYHEHFSYYSLLAVEKLMRRHGLVVSDVEHTAIHGGSLRYFISHDNHVVSKNVDSLLQKEIEQGVGELAFYQAFSEKVLALRQELIQFLLNLKKNGKRIAAYGASAKGCTLLNFAGIGSDLLDFVVDRSTVKQGHFTPGTRLPILPPEALLTHQPDYVLLLTWNFRDEILTQQAAYRERGGRFIVPVPTLAVC